MATLYDDWSGYTLDQIPTGYTRLLSSPGDWRVRSESGTTADRLLELSGIGGNQDWLTPDSVASSSTAQQSLVVGRRRDTSQLLTWDLCAAVRASPSVETAYQAGIYGGTNFRLFSVVAGSYTTLQTISFTYALGDWVAIRVEIDGSTLRGRVWKWTDPEPSTWQLSVTNTAIASGKPGLARRQGTGSPDATDFDFWSAGTDGDAAPLSAGGTPLATPTDWAFVKTAAGVRSVTGSWSSVVGASTYDYEVRRWTGSAWVAFAAGNTAATTFVLDDSDGVDWATQYQARVRAVPA